jgi:hypothetical protein
MHHLEALLPLQGLDDVHEEADRWKLAAYFNDCCP